MEVDNRACNQCREILPNTEFYERNDGYVNFICKPCTRKREKRHRGRMKQHLWWRVKQTEQTKAYNERKKNESAPICQID